MQPTNAQIQEARDSFKDLNAKDLQHKYMALQEKAKDLESCRYENGAMDWDKASEKHGIDNAESFAKFNADLIASNKLRYESRSIDAMQRDAEDRVEGMVNRANDMFGAPAAPAFDNLGGEIVRGMNGRLMIDSGQAFMNAAIERGYETDMPKEAHRAFLLNTHEIQTGLSFEHFMRDGVLIPPGSDSGDDRYRNVMIQGGTAAGVRATPHYDESFVGSQTSREKVGLAPLVPVRRGNGSDTFNFRQIISRTNTPNPLVPVAENANMGQVESTTNWTKLDLTITGAYTEASMYAMRNPTFLRQFINNEMAKEVALMIENEILNGTNTGSRWNGLVTNTNVQTSARGATVWGVDEIGKACREIDTKEGLMATHVVMNPADWWNYVLLKITDGRSVHGDTFGTFDSIPMTILGKRVVMAPKCPAGTVFVLDMDAIFVADDGVGLLFGMTDSNDTNFIKGVDTFRVAGRGALGYAYDKGVYKITNWNAENKAR